MASSFVFPIIFVCLCVVGIEQGLTHSKRMFYHWVTPRPSNNLPSSLISLKLIKDLLIFPEAKFPNF
jgi:hypothetical protein